MTSARRAAAFAFAGWRASGAFPAGLLPRGEGRAAAQDILYTAVRRMRPLRMVLGELLSTWPKGELEALLFVGAAQVLYMPDVPEYAAVHETVEAAKACGNPSIARVVNGVLRNLIRRRAEFEAKIAASPLEVRESYPTALVRRWTARFGADGAERLAMWHNEPAVTYLAYPGRFEPLARGKRVEDAEGFEQGRFIVQDPATRHAVDALGPQPGDKILDYCAAPGGKTVQTAWRGAQVFACEINPARRLRLEENLRRTGLGDAVRVLSSPDEAAACGPYGKILVDAPCSNTGVLRRRPDARWNFSEEKLSQLVALQAGILDTAAGMLAPGGLLVYSTCSCEQEENEGQCESFLARHPNFSKVSCAASLPHESGEDGAFAAAFREAGEGETETVK